MASILTGWLFQFCNLNKEHISVIRKANSQESIGNSLRFTIRYVGKSILYTKTSDKIAMQHARHPTNGQWHSNGPPVHKFARNSMRELLQSLTLSCEKNSKWTRSRKNSQHEKIWHSASPSEATCYFSLTRNWKFPPIGKILSGKSCRLTFQ